jgi:hypothetical protein
MKIIVHESDYQKVKRRRGRRSGGPLLFSDLLITFAQRKQAFKSWSVFS